MKKERIFSFHFDHRGNIVRDINPTLNEASDMKRVKSTHLEVLPKDLVEDVFFRFSIRFSALRSNRSFFLLTGRPSPEYRRCRSHRRTHRGRRHPRWFWFWFWL
jgi:hypothetical protein